MRWDSGQTQLEMGQVPESERAAIELIDRFGQEPVLGGASNERMKDVVNLDGVVDIAARYGPLHVSQIGVEGGQVGFCGPLRSHSSHWHFKEQSRFEQRLQVSQTERPHVRCAV